jgi:hypothetical protein
MRRRLTRSSPSRGQPKVDLSEIPHRTARCQVKAFWKVASLFHLIDRRISQRDKPAELLAADNGLGFDDLNG